MCSELVPVHVSKNITYLFCQANPIKSRSLSFLTTHNQNIPNLVEDTASFMKSDNTEVNHGHHS